MELLFHIIFIKLLGWIDNNIKYFSYILLIYFLIKFFSKLKKNKILLTDSFFYFLFFYFFIALFFINSFIIQNNLSNIYIKTLSMYLYNFTLSLFFFVNYNSLNYKKLINIFLFYLILVLVIDIVFLYDFFSNYSVGFIHHIEKNVATVYYGRGCGFFSDPTASSTVVLSFPILLFSIGKYLYIRYFKLLFIMSFISIVITTSKLGILLYLYEIFLLNLLISKKKFYNNLFKSLIYLTVVISILIIIVIYLYTIGIESIVQIVDFFLNPTSQKTLVERIYTYDMAFNIINNNILLGIGAGNPQSIIGLSIHNTILHLFAENGIIGICFLIYFYIIFPYLIFKKINFLYLKYAFIIWWQVFFIKSMFADVMHTHVVIIYFLVMGVLYNFDNFLKGKNNEKDIIYKWFK